MRKARSWFSSLYCRKPVKLFGESALAGVAAIGQVCSAGKKIASQLVEGVFKVRRQITEPLHFNRELWRRRRFTERQPD